MGHSVAPGEVRNCRPSCRCVLAASPRSGELHVTKGARRRVYGQAVILHDYVIEHQRDRGRRDSHLRFGVSVGTSLDKCVYSIPLGLATTRHTATATLDW